MPLESGPVGGPAFKHNIEEMVSAGHPQKQAVAAAYNKAQGDSDPHNVHGYMDACLRGDSNPARHLRTK